MIAKVLTSRERRLLLVLVGVFSAAVCLVGAIQIFGGGIGAPCRDSYSCRGFLVGGAECVVDGESYCTVYCKTDERCPRGWHCGNAHPTVLTVETQAVGKVCLRP
jgi:hypothetical protein